MKRNTSKANVLFCGLMRKPEMFKKSIQDLSLMRKDGLINQIIFSTWTGELEKSPEIESFLKENKVKIIKTEEPKDRGYGNIWCQMKALEVGLSEIEENEFVLKTRSDVYIHPDFLKKIFSSSQLFKITKNLPKGNIFQNKVWVHWFELTRPFYMADECFYGTRYDLKKLINYNTRYDIEFNIGPGISHIRRFIHPFLNDYPILTSSLGKYSQGSNIKTLALKFSKKYFDLRKIPFFRKFNEKKRFNLLKRRLEDEEFLDCLASYYSILYSHFYIDGDSFPNQVTFSEFSFPATELDLENIENNFTKEKARLSYGGQIHVYNLKLINNLFDSKVAQTPLSQRLKQAIDKFNNKKI